MMKRLAVLLAMLILAVAASGARAQCLITGADSMCVGGFTDLAGPNGFCYSWTGPNGFVDQGQNIHVVDVPGPGPGVYTLTITDPADCFSNPHVCQITVRYGQLPSCRIVGPAAVCLGATQVRFDAVSSPGSHLNWAVLGNAVITSLADGPFVIVDFPTAGIPVVQCVAIIQGCFSPLAGQSVKVLTSLAPILSGPTLACPGATTLFHISSPVLPATYQWSVGPGAQIVGSNSDSVVQVLTINPPFTIGCLVNAGACGGSANRVISAGIAPDVSITGEDTIYIGQTRVYHADTPNSISTLQWVASGAGTLVSAAGDSARIRGVSSGLCNLSVTATTNQGCTGVALKTVRVDSLPEVHILGPGPLCAKQTGVVYRARANFPVATYQWSINDSAVIVGSSKSDTVVVNARGPGSFKLLLHATLAPAFAVLRPQGLRPEIAIYSADTTRTVQVLAPPTCAITPPGPFCTGARIVFTAQTFPTGVTSLWGIRGNGTIEGASGPTVTVMAGDVGSFTLFDTISSGACASVCSLRVSVSKPLTCSIAGQDQLCADNSSNYAGSANLTGATYSWRVAGRGQLSGPQTGPTTAVLAGDFGSLVLTLTAYAQGCTSSASRTVQALPDPQASIQGPPRLFVGVPATFEATGNLNGLSYQWSVSHGPATIQGSTVASSVTITPGDTGAVQLSLLLGNGACVHTETADGRVELLPTCGIDGPSTGCSGGADLAFAALTGLQGATYQWQVTDNGTLRGTGTVPTVFVTPGLAGTFKITLNVRTASEIRTCSKVVTISNAPVCRSFGPAAIVAQDARLYSIPDDPAYRGAAYAWSVTGPGLLVGAADGPAVTVGATAPGLIVLSLALRRGGCASTCTQEITVNPTPPAAISGKQVCVGDAGIEYVALTSLDTPRYRWTVSGSATPGSQLNGNTLVVNPSGNYRLTLHVAGGSDSADAQVDVVPSPLPSLAINIPAALPACGSEGNLLGSRQFSGGPVSLEWSVQSPRNDWIITSEDYLSTISYKAGTSGPATFTLRSTNASGCFASTSIPVDCTQLPEPQVTGIYPDAVALTGTRTVTIVGSNFDESGSYSLGAGVGALEHRVVSPETLVVTVRPDANAQLGPRDVSVSNSTGTAVLRNGLRVVARPVLSMVNPDTAAGGVPVSLRGRGFEPGIPNLVEIVFSPVLSEQFNAVPTGDTLISIVIPETVPAGSGSVVVHAYGAVTLPATILVLPLIPGDITGDGRVDLQDLSRAAGFIMERTVLAGRARAAADCNSDAAVNVFDLVCMVDVAARPAARVSPAGLGIRGVAHWNPATRVLTLPEEATAAQWRSSGTVAARATARGVQAWSVRGAEVVGVVARTTARQFQLPEGTGEVVEVIWGDEAGRLWLARIGGAESGAKFGALANPQRGTLWFTVPAHGGPAYLDLFDVRGARVASRALSASEDGALAWRPSPALPAGLYFARYRARGEQRSAKLLYLP